MVQYGYLNSYKHLLSACFFKESFKEKLIHWTITSCWAASSVLFTTPHPPTSTCHRIICLPRWLFILFLDTLLYRNWPMWLKLAHLTFTSRWAASSDFPTLPHPPLFAKVQYVFQDGSKYFIWTHYCLELCYLIKEKSIRPFHDFEQLSVTPPTPPKSTCHITIQLSTSNLQHKYLPM